MKLGNHGFLSDKKITITKFKTKIITILVNGVLYLGVASLVPGCSGPKEAPAALKGRVPGWSRENRLKILFFIILIYMFALNSIMKTDNQMTNMIFSGNTCVI